jgi:hypothetical protein
MELAVMESRIMNRYLGALIILGLLQTARMGAQQPRCDRLADQTSDQLTSFLKESLDFRPARRDVACITFAIRNLEYQPSAENTELLTKYLDFHRPLSPEEKQGFWVSGLPDDENLYPAISTLSTFGEKILPGPVEIVKHSDTEIMRRNAARTAFDVYHGAGYEAIALMRQEASKAQGVESSRLNAAAQEAVKWCGRLTREKCKAAADAKD